MYYDHKRKNGMNSNFFYFLTAGGRYIMPAFPKRMSLERILRKVDTRSDRNYIYDRAEYYNKLAPDTLLGNDAIKISELRLKDHHSFSVMDSYEYLRYFPRHFRWTPLFGDITIIPDVPSITKSRPIEGDNANSVLLNLDKMRHFTFIDDRTPFREKQDRFIFRGHVNRNRKINRVQFMEEYFGHPMGDCAITHNDNDDYPQEWKQSPITIWEQLTYKFNMALEGNDVASNLKWIMSSNSVAVTPRPVYETWFMEGRLVPDVHYIEIKPDHSDLIQKLEHFLAHPAEAEEIIRNAHEYIEAFLNPEREKLISLLVLDKYFRMTGQK